MKEYHRCKAIYHLRQLEEALEEELEEALVFVALNALCRLPGTKIPCPNCGNPVVTSALQCEDCKDLNLCVRCEREVPGDMKDCPDCHPEACVDCWMNPCNCDEECGIIDMLKREALSALDTHSCSEKDCIFCKFRGIIRKWK